MPVAHSRTAPRRPAPRPLAARRPGRARADAAAAAGRPLQLAGRAGAPRRAAAAGGPGGAPRRHGDGPRGRDGGCVGARAGGAGGWAQAGAAHMHRRLVSAAPSFPSRLPCAAQAAPPSCCRRARSATSRFGATCCAAAARPSRAVARRARSTQPVLQGSYPPRSPTCRASQRPRARWPRRCGARLTAWASRWARCAESCCAAARARPRARRRKLDFLISWGGRGAARRRFARARGDAAGWGRGGPVRSSSPAAVKHDYGGLRDRGGSRRRGPRVPPIARPPRPGPRRPPTTADAGGRGPGGPRRGAARPDNPPVTHAARRAAGSDGAAGAAAPGRGRG
jgi:hypothetical protein